MKLLKKYYTKLLFVLSSIVFFAQGNLVMAIDVNLNAQTEEGSADQSFGAKIKNFLLSYPKVITGVFGTVLVTVIGLGYLYKKRNKNIVIEGYDENNNINNNTNINNGPNTENKDNASGSDSQDNNVNGVNNVELNKNGNNNNNTNTNNSDNSPDTDSEDNINNPEENNGHVSNTDSEVNNEKNNQDIDHKHKDEDHDITDQENILPPSALKGIIMKGFVGKLDDKTTSSLKVYLKNLKAIKREKRKNIKNEKINDQSKKLKFSKELKKYEVDMLLGIYALKHYVETSNTDLIELFNSNNEDSLKVKFTDQFYKVLPNNEIVKPANKVSNVEFTIQKKNFVDGDSRDNPKEEAKKGSVIEYVKSILDGVVQNKNKNVSNYDILSYLRFLYPWLESKQFWHLIRTKEFKGYQFYYAIQEYVGKAIQHSPKEGLPYLKKLLQDKGLGQLFGVEDIGSLFEEKVEKSNNNDQATSSVNQNKEKVAKVNDKINSLIGGLQYIIARLVKLIVDSQLPNYINRRVGKDELQSEYRSLLNLMLSLVKNNNGKLNYNQQKAIFTDFKSFSYLKVDQAHPLAQEKGFGQDQSVNFLAYVFEKREIFNQLEFDYLLVKGTKKSDYYEAVLEGLNNDWKYTEKIRAALMPFTEMTYNKNLSEEKASLFRGRISRLKNRLEENMSCDLAEIIAMISYVASKAVANQQNNDSNSLLNHLKNLLTLPKGKEVFASIFNPYSKPVSHNNEKKSIYRYALDVILKNKENDKIKIIKDIFVELRQDNKDKDEVKALLNREVLEQVETGKIATISDDATQYVNARLRKIQNLEKKEITMLLQYVLLQASQAKTNDKDLIVDNFTFSNSTLQGQEKEVLMNYVTQRVSSLISNAKSKKVKLSGREPHVLLSYLLQEWIESINVTTETVDELLSSSNVDENKNQIPSTHKKQSDKQKVTENIELAKLLDELVAQCEPEVFVPRLNLIKGVGDGSIYGYIQETIKKLQKINEAVTKINDKITGWLKKIGYEKDEIQGLLTSKTIRKDFSANSSMKDAELGSKTKAYTKAKLTRLQIHKNLTIGEQERLFSSILLSALYGESSILESIGKTNVGEADTQQLNLDKVDRKQGPEKKDTIYISAQVFRRVLGDSATKLILHEKKTSSSLRNFPYIASYEYLADVNAKKKNMPEFLKNVEKVAAKVGISKEEVRRLLYPRWDMQHINIDPRSMMKKPTIGGDPRWNNNTSVLVKVNTNTQSESLNQEAVNFDKKIKKMVWAGHEIFEEVKKELSKINYQYDKNNKKDARAHHFALALLLENTILKYNENTQQLELVTLLDYLEWFDKKLHQKTIDLLSKNADQVKENLKVNENDDNKIDQ